MNQTPEDSVLRRHYEQLQQAQPSQGGGHRPQPAATASTTAGSGSQPQKGFLGRLLDKLFGA